MEITHWNKNYTSINKNRGVVNQKKRMKITLLFGLLILCNHTFGQNNKTDFKNELNKIDSIVKSINKNENKYLKGRAEGPIIYKCIFRKNGGWGAHYLYKNKNDKLPIRIKYNAADNRTYKKMKFYYQNGELIYSELKVKFYRGKRKNKPIEKKYYFENSKLIFESNSEIEDYNSEYITLTEKSTREMIFE